MADYKEPRTAGSISGGAGTATHSTETNSSSTSGLVGRVREQATAQLDTQKNKATEGLGTVAEAFRETTRHLREGQHDTVAHYAEQAANQIDQFSQRLRNKDVTELMNDAQQLARRKPALFIGGAFALGLMGARFMKSSKNDDAASDRAGEYASGAHLRVGEYGSSGQMSTGSSAQAGSGIAQVQNAYGNRVPPAGSSRGTTASSTSAKPRTASTRRPDYPSTEGL
jgi:hypothetical protein